MLKLDSDLDGDIFDILLLRSLGLDGPGKPQPVPVGERSETKRSPSGWMEHVRIHVRTYRKVMSGASARMAFNT